jgi:hypothetical protein
MEVERPADGGQPSAKPLPPSAVMLEYGGALYEYSYFIELISTVG